MNLISKTALALTAAAGFLTLTAPQAEARHYVRVYNHGYGSHYYGGYYRRPVVVYRSYDPYYYDSYYGGYGYPRYGSYGYGGPSFSFAFGGHGYHGGHGYYGGHHGGHSHHGHHH